MVMISPDIGDDYLDHFDELNLDKKQDRRIGISTLENFTGEVLQVLGQHVSSIRREKISYQWYDIRKELHQIDDSSVPSQYQNLVDDIKEERNRVYRDFERGVKKPFLSEVRGLAPDWRNWIYNQCETYCD